MTKASISVFVLLSAAACTTPATVGSNQPFWSGTTKSSRQLVASCVALRWGEAKGFHVRTKDDGDNTLVLLSGSSVTGVDMVAKIAEDGTIEVHKRPAAWGRLDDKLRDDAAECSGAK